MLRNLGKVIKQGSSHGQIHHVGNSSSFVKNVFEEKKAKGRKNYSETVVITLKYIGIEKQAVGIERRGWIGSKQAVRKERRGWVSEILRRKNL